MTLHSAFRTPHSALGPDPLAGLGAVTFDIGGTLLEPWPSVGHLYAEVAARHGWKGLSPEVLNQRFRAAWQAQKNFEHTREQWAALVEATFGELIGPGASEQLFPELYQRFTEPEAWHVFADVVPALSALRGRGLKLGVVSNWDERLRPLLEVLELTSYFESIVISCEVGCPKPGREIFARAAQELGLSPERILHVGDSLELDVRGAEAAGFRALRLRRRTPPVGQGEIRSLRELT